MKLIVTIFLCILSLHAFAQYKNGLGKYFDTSQYNIVDSVSLDHKGHIVYVIFDNTDESILLYRKNDSYSVYNGFLSCYSCQGKGSTSPTYSGHARKGKWIVFVQESFSGRDSVYLDFSKPIPVIQKIIRRSYSSTDIQGPDYSGNYLFTAKKDAPINKFSLPIDRMDPIIKKYFYAKKNKMEASAVITVWRHHTSSVTRITRSGGRFRV